MACLGLADLGSPIQSKYPIQLKLNKSDTIIQSHAWLLGNKEEKEQSNIRLAKCTHNGGLSLLAMPVSI